MRDTNELHRGHGKGAAEPDSMRRVGRVLVVLLLLATLIVTMLNVLLRPEAPEVSGWATVSVGESSTLWQVATEHPIPGLSTAEAIDAIRLENGLPSGVIHVGQVLRVPAGSSDAAVEMASR